MRNQPPYLIAEDYALTTADGDYVEIPSQATNNIQQLRSFITERLDFVDGILMPQQ